MRRVALLVNPQAGRGDALARAGDVSRLLGPLGRVEQIVTDEAGLAAAARTAAARGDIVIVSGGDGTMNRVVNAIAGIHATVGVLPSGSGNDLARALQLPLDVRAAAAQLAKGRTRAVDLVAVNGSLFCTVGGVGLVADAARTIARLSRPGAPLRRPVRWLGGTAYLVAGAAHVFTSRRPTLDLRAAGTGPDGDWTWSGPCHALFIANQPTLGAGLSMPVAASGGDGAFEVCIVPRRGRVSLAGRLTALRHGTPQPESVLLVRRATRATIEFDAETAFVGDGEVLLGESRQLAAEIRRGALQMLV